MYKPLSECTYAVGLPIVIARGLKGYHDGGVHSPSERLLRKAEDEAVLAILNEKRRRNGYKEMLTKLPSKQNEDEHTHSSFYQWLARLVKVETQDSSMTDSDRRLLPPWRYIRAYRRNMREGEKDLQGAA